MGWILTYYRKSGGGGKEGKTTHGRQVVVNYISTIRHTGGKKRGAGG